MSGDVVEVPQGDLLPQGGGLGLGPLVGPDDGGPQGVALLIHAQAPHHLAGEGDCGDVAGVDAGLVNQVAAGDADGLPEILGILLGPVGVEVVAVVAEHLAGDHFPLVAEQGCLVAGGAQIVGQYVFHRCPPALQAQIVECDTKSRN